MLSPEPPAPGTGVLRYFTVHVNKHTAKYGADGGVRIVVAHTPPPAAPADGGAPFNWIDTAGHAEGTMCFRWVKPAVPDDALPHPLARVVPFAQL